MTDRPRSGSLSFDRAAEYYDRTRTISPEARERVVELLRDEIGGRAPCLDVGVGTGQIALPLHEAGVSMVGLDISPAMVRKLVEKAGGARPFPLVLGDATMLPFKDARFGSAIVRHLLQVIPAWERAVSEVVRGVRRGGVVLVNQAIGSEALEEIFGRLEATFGGLGSPVGLHWGNMDALDRAMQDNGARRRELPVVVAKGDMTVGSFLDQVDQGLHSWTWRIDDEARGRAVGEVRSWAEERFGGLDSPIDSEYPIRWRAYDLPG